MKILTEEEIEAHHYHTLSGGVKGTVAGLVISGLLFRYAPVKFPKFQPKRMPWSLKTAMFITPPTLLASIGAEEASTSFDNMMYGSGSASRDAIEEHRRWKSLPLSEKLTEGASNHKYKIIVAAWAASMWGSWKFVDRDPIMTKTQKAVQARMYAQGLTVMLLLGSIGLSMYEEKLHPDAKKLDRSKRWERLLERAEEEEARAQKEAGFRSNEDRVKAKIFK
ncbi:HIG1 domain-containing protein [Lachancea thermotolerans]|uniref:KLTH0A06138p n=1 Tax=Lachancea thermotolerans (strain ATCC 56472 / CBS 6340 / NRRL Y-8284) TaxID=559295 RepID=C5DBX6_LACTC|nr:KLTH0A06138p [Lachancea thermotolerans CBS 6340]CAR21283.1 KLTH0A06138p [Lachancea thermotolerans CBS 6340]